MSETPKPAVALEESPDVCEVSNDERLRLSDSFFLDPISADYLLAKYAGIKLSFDRTKNAFLNDSQTLLIRFTDFSNVNRVKSTTDCNLPIASAFIWESGNEIGFLTPEEFSRLGLLDPSVDYKFPDVEVSLDELGDILAQENTFLLNDASNKNLLEIVELEPNQDSSDWNLGKRRPLYKIDLSNPNSISFALLDSIGINVISSRNFAPGVSVDELLKLQEKVNKPLVDAVKARS